MNKPLDKSQDGRAPQTYDPCVPVRMSQQKRTGAHEEAVGMLLARQSFHYSPVHDLHFQAS